MIKIVSMHKTTLSLLCLLLMSCSSARVGVTEPEKTAAPFKDGKFDNIEPFSDKSFWQLMKWRFFVDRKPWPKEVETQTIIPPQRVEGDELKFTVLNHASILIQHKGLNILTDPHYSERCSPVSWAGPKRVRKPAVKFDDLPPIDVVLISHNHYDHLDVPTLKRLHEKFNPIILMGLKNHHILNEANISNWVELDWWQEYQVKDISFTFVPAQHWSARGLFDRFESLWGGFVFKSQSRSIYFAGDTGYGKFFKMIRDKLGSPDLSFIPIGAYEPRWFMKDSHLNPQDAVDAHHDLASKVSVGIHLETFQLTDEDYETPRKEFKKAWEKSNKENTFIPPEFGRLYDLKDF